MAAFHTQLPLRDPTSSFPAAVEVFGVAVTSQSAVSLPDGVPHATEVTAAIELDRPGHRLPESSRHSGRKLPVQMAGLLVGLPGAVPMATQSLAVHESPVIDWAVPWAERRLECPRAPVRAVTEVERSTGSIVLTPSLLVPVATHTDAPLELGQAIVPTEVRVDGVPSRVKVGDQLWLVAKVAGSPSS